MIAHLHAFATVGFLLAFAVIGGVAMHVAHRTPEQRAAARSRRSLLVDTFRGRP